MLILKGEENSGIYALAFCMCCLHANKSNCLSSAYMFHIVSYGTGVLVFKKKSRNHFHSIQICVCRHNLQKGVLDAAVK